MKVIDNDALLKYSTDSDPTEVREVADRVESVSLRPSDADVAQVRSEGMFDEDARKFEEDAAAMQNNYAKSPIDRLTFWECINHRGVAFRSVFGDMESRVLDRLGPKYQEVI